MEMHATEEQQIESFKKWWKDNAGSIITGVLLGLAILFGVRSWFAYQERTAEAASNIYTTLMNALSNGQESLVNDQAGVLISDYSSTPYAPLAALSLAKVKLEKGELQAAHAQLQWALDHAGSDVIRHTARLRLARVMMAEDDLDGAEALADHAGDEGGFASLYAEIRGDIQLARGDAASARVQYEHALAMVTAESPGRQLLQLKYDSTAPAAGPGDAR
jgi:predicted negative regulator of RcsB-dependent stress response